MEPRDYLVSSVGDDATENSHHDMVDSGYADEHLYSEISAVNAGVSIQSRGRREYAHDESIVDYSVADYTPPPVVGSDLGLSSPILYCWWVGWWWVYYLLRFSKVIDYL